MNILYGNDKDESMCRRFDRYIRLGINTIARDVVEKEDNYRRRIVVSEQAVDPDFNYYEDRELERMEWEVFHVSGCEIRICDEQLADALQRLGELRRNIMLLTFIGFNDAEIAGLLKVLPATVQSERSRAYKDIRRFYESDTDRF